MMLSKRQGKWSTIVQSLAIFYPFGYYIYTTVEAYSEVILL